MEQLNAIIENQYHQPGLFENIVNRLNDKGVDFKNVSRNHLAAVDEFHVRRAEVSKELANL